MPSQPEPIRYVVRERIQTKVLLFLLFVAVTVNAAVNPYCNYYLLITLFGAIDFTSVVGLRSKFIQYERNLCHKNKNNVLGNQGSHKT